MTVEDGKATRANAGRIPPPQAPPQAWRQDMWQHWQPELLLLCFFSSDVTATPRDVQMMLASNGSEVRVAREAPW